MCSKSYLNSCIVVTYRAYLVIHAVEKTHVQTKLFETQKISNCTLYPISNNKIQLLRYPPKKRKINYQDNGKRRACFLNNKKYFIANYQNFFATSEIRNKIKYLLDVNVIFYLLSFPVPIFFSNLNSNCSNTLDPRSLKE